MATNIQWSALHTSRVLPAGYYNLRIASAELGHNTYSGRLQITLELRVEAPDFAKGKGHYEFLELGKTPFKTIKPEWSAEYQAYAEINDPNFEDPRVHQMSKELKTFKRMLECGGFQFPDEAPLEDIVALSVGKVFTADVIIEVEQYGKRKGEDKNVLGAILPFGTETPGIKAVATATTAVSKPGSPRPILATAIRPAPMLTRQNGSAAPNFFEDDDEDVPF